MYMSDTITLAFTKNYYKLRKNVVVSVLLSKIVTVYVQLFTSEVAIVFCTNPDFPWHQSTEYNSEVARGEADHCFPFNAAVMNVLSQLTLFYVVVLKSGPSVEGCRAQGEEIFAAPHLPTLLFSSQKSNCCNLFIQF